MIIVFCLSLAIVSLAVVFHYECIRFLSQQITRFRTKHRVNILIGVLGALVAHCIEIWFFAFGYYFAANHTGIGSFDGNFNGSLLDCVYFSFTTYTTLGFGDIAPVGDIRFLVGMESLTGLVLITWTASFLFVEMQTYWQKSFKS